MLLLIVAELIVIDGAFASMIILLSAVNEGIGASFVRAFEDHKVEKDIAATQSKYPDYMTYRYFHAIPTFIVYSHDLPCFFKS